MQEVGRQVIYQQGCFSRVKIWYAGHIKGINGILTHGWQGEEQTMVTRDVIMPIHTFEVKQGEVYDLSSLSYRSRAA